MKSEMHHHMLLRRAPTLNAALLCSKISWTSQVISIATSGEEEKPDVSKYVRP